MEHPSTNRPGARLIPPHTLMAKARRDIRRQLTQFLAVALTVLLGVALFVASFDAFHNLESSYQTTYDRLHFADLTVTGGDLAKFASDTRGTEGVSAVTTRTQADLPMKIGSLRLLGRVIGMPAKDQPAVDRVDVVAGSYLSPDQPNGVLIESHAAEHFKLEPGSRLNLGAGGTTQQVTVIGVVDSAEYLWPARSRQDVITDPDSFAVVFAPQALTRSLSGTSTPNQALVELSAHGRTGDTVAAVESAARSAGASDIQTRADQPSNSALHEDISGFAELSIAFPLLFLTAAAIAAYVLLTRRVLSEKPVIAMLLAGGARRRPLVVHYLSQGVFAGLLGAIPGVGLGVALTTVITRTYTSAIGVPDTVVGHQLSSALMGLIFGALVGVVGSVVPAISASRVAPAEAMRGIAPSTGGPNRWSRLVTRATWLPTTTRMALRDVVRSRRRTIATMVGVVLALVLILASGGMIDTTRSQIDLQFNQITRENADVAVIPSRQQVVSREVRGLAGVTATETAITGPMSLQANGRSYATTIFGYQSNTVMHRFHSTDGTWLSLPTHGVLAGRAVASQLGVHTGDALTLTAANGAKTTTKLAGFLDEPFGTFIYATTDLAREALGSAPGTVPLVLTRYDTDANATSLRRQVSEIPGVVAYTNAAALRTEVDQYLGLFWVFIATMAVLGGILAFVAIFITMTVNVSERTTELATLRAAGVPLRRIGALLATGNLMATALGIAPGLVAGYFTARWFMQSFSSDMFRFELSLSWTTILLAVLAVMAAALISQVPAIRAIKRLDIAKVVRERAA